MNQEPLQTDPGRRGERGAALVTALLISLLMLAAGGALIYTTGMSATNAIDATAEAQAYYAAEAGLHSAVTVLRGNVQALPELNLAAGTKIRNDLRVANQLSTSNLTDDEATEARLSGWLPYDGTSTSARVPLDDNGQTGFQVTLSDPNDANRATLTANASYAPKTLVITSTGYGPKGAVKRMQLLYSRQAFDFDPKSTVLMAGNVSHFDVGSSRAKGYSGKDEADAAAPALPAFGFTSAASTAGVTASTFDCAKMSCTKASESTSDPATSTILPTDLPAFLQTPQAASALLDLLQAEAVGEGRYFATKDDAKLGVDIGTANDPKFTFVDGDLSVSGSGAGLLVVTGDVTFKGGFDFDGLILILGSYENADGDLVGGSLLRNGGGDGTIAGAVIVAKFDRDDPKAFLDTSFDTNGGGNSDVVYDSKKVSNALGVMGGRLLGFIEN